jgi:hypothetical protein
MVKYELRITYDPAKDDVVTVDVNRNWPKHYEELKKTAEDRVRRMAREGKLANLTETIRIS